MHIFEERIDENLIVLIIKEYVPMCVHQIMTFYTLHTHNLYLLITYLKIKEFMS
jgi:hypothetical protein